MVLANTREIKAGGTAPKCLAFIFLYSQRNCWPGEVNGELLGLVFGWGGCFCGCCLPNGPRLKGTPGTASALWSSRTDRAWALTFLGGFGDFLLPFMAVGGKFLSLVAVERGVTILVWTSLTYISNSFSVVFLCVCLLVVVLFCGFFCLVVFVFQISQLCIATFAEASCNSLVAGRFHSSG